MTRIITADLEQLDEVARLFDLYRQFYEQAADLPRARAYIEARMQKGESTIFLAHDGSGAGLGFTQLYATFCSVAAVPIFVLYDLYVDAPGRRHGVGRALMLHAQEFARNQGAARMQLETAIDNLPGQALYEALGWERDTQFYSYAFDLGDSQGD